MQNILCFLLILAFSVGTAQASNDDCNSILKSGWESSLTDLAALRIDLDLLRANGTRSTLEHALEIQYGKKFNEVLAAKNRSVSQKQFESLLTQKVTDQQKIIDEQRRLIAERSKAQETAIHKDLPKLVADAEEYTPLPWAFTNGFALKTSENEVVLATVSRFYNRVDYANLNLLTHQFQASSAQVYGPESVQFVNASKVYVETEAQVLDFDLKTNLPVKVAEFKREAGLRGSIALSNGQSVFSGGSSREEGWMNDVGLYDPSSLRLEMLPALNVPRAHHQLVQLHDGRILVIGGIGDGGKVLKEIEIIDPIAKTTTLFGALTEGRSKFTATVLSDGRVVIVGHSKLVELIDVDAGVVGPILELPENRDGHAATLLPDDRILISGGTSHDIRLDSILLIDPNRSSVKQIGTLKAGRSGHQHTLISDHEILVLGGQLKSGSELLTEKITFKVAE